MATTESSATTTTDSPPLDLVYLANFSVGNVGLPGAPVLYVQALVNAANGSMSGHAEIRQAIDPPPGTIHNLTGQIVGILVRDVPMRMVTLSGTYQANPVQPLEQPFSASLFIEANEWKGSGSFTYGASQVNDVPVRPQD